MTVLPSYACHLLSLHSSEMNTFKPRIIDGDQSIVVSLFSFLFVLVVLVFVFSPTSDMMGKVSVYGPT